VTAVPSLPSDVAGGGAGTVFQELITVGALVLFLLWFPRLLFRTLATGHYAGIGVTLKPRRPRVGPGPLASVVVGVQPR
jgi:hypothetical protein